MNPVNRCRTCSATSYKPVIKRDGNGRMCSSGQYQCVGCRLVFTSINEWRLGAAAHPTPSIASAVSCHARWDARVDDVSKLVAEQARRGQSSPASAS